MTPHRLGFVLTLAWALLLPPRGEHGSRASTGQGQDVIAWFTSSEQCEAVRSELIEGAGRRLGDPWMIPDPGDPGSGDGRPSPTWTDSRCLPREEPRPPGSTRD